MPYQPRCLDTLRSFPEKFIENYKGTNSKRLSFIALLDQIVELTKDQNDEPENLINVLTGWQGFLMADIKFQEYKGKSPSTKKSTLATWFTGKGSDFYTFSREKFNINSKNKFIYEERLFYLYEFSQWVEKNYSEESLKELAHHPLLKKYDVKLFFKSKTQLLEEIDKVLQFVLDRNKEHLTNLVNSIPVLSALTKNMGKLASNHQEKSRNPTNPKRLQVFNCIQLILESNPSAKDNAWHICAGAILSVLLEIDNVEYKYWKWFWSSNHSTLLKDGLSTLNQEDLTKIPVNQKMLWLESLKNHLENMMNDKTNYEKILSETVKKINKPEIETIKKIKKQEITVTILDDQIKSFQTKINEQLITLKKEKDTPSLMGYAVSTMTSYSVQYGLSTAANASKDIIGASFHLGGLFAQASGPLAALALFGAGLLTDKILEAASANLFAWVIQKIADSVGNAACALITQSFSPTPKGLQELREKLAPDQDKIFVRMVNSMLKLRIISEDYKRHIRETLDLKVGEELQLLKPEILTEEEKKYRNEMLIHGQICKVKMSMR